VRYFAGLDVSLEETAIFIVDEAGGIVREARVASEPDALVAFFDALGLTMERVGLEACSLTAWLHQGLSEAGIPAVCIETRQAKAAMGAMPNKTDRNDARGIAQIMRTGWYRAVHVKSPSCRSWRALLTARRMALNKRRDVENGVRALLREAGLKVGTPSRKDFPARVRELAAGDAVLTGLVESLLSVIRIMTDEVGRLTKRVLDEVRVEPTCRHLMTVPGVGPLTALAFRATVDRPDRFRKSRDVGAHLGLTPRRYQSGETDVQGRISRCGDELARTALYEAAHSLPIRSTKWSALRAWGMQVAKRRGMALRSPASWRSSCTACGSTSPSSAGASKLWRRDERNCSFRLKRRSRRRSRGDDGRGDLVESPEPEGSKAPKVAGQIEAPRPPDPIMRRPRADREEKRVIHGRGIGQEARGLA
jgi:transposase